MATKDKFVTGLIAGTLIGAAIGLLMAPKTGEETRKVVKERTDGWKQRAGDYIGTLRERFNQEQDILVAPEHEHSGNGVQHS